MDELLLDIKIEKLEEGGYLATSKSVPGLIAHDRPKSPRLRPAERNAESDNRADGVNGGRVHETLDDCFDPADSQPP